MGRRVDAVAAGESFLPPPSQMAGILWDWDPRTDDLAELDLPMCDDWEFYARAVTPGKNTSIDLQPYAGENPQRMYGFVGQIDFFAKSPHS